MISHYQLFNLPHPIRKETQKYLYIFTTIAAEIVYFDDYVVLWDNTMEVLDLLEKVRQYGAEWNRQGRLRP